MSDYKNPPGWDSSYRTVFDVAEWDERYAPVVGWGMNPHLAGPARIGIGGYTGLGAREGLGYDAYVDANLADIAHVHKDFSLPIEQYATDAVNKNWPQVHDLIQKQVPVLLGKAADAGVTAALNQAWPAVQRQIEAEAPRLAAGAVSEVKKSVFLTVGVVSAAILVGAWFARGGK